MANDIVSLVSGLVGILVLILFIVMTANISSIKGLLKPRTFKCSHCGYIFSVLYHASPFCPRCNKDSEGKTSEDYQ